MRAGRRLNVMGVVCMAALLSGSISKPDTPLADAARRGEVETVRSLLAQGADVNGAQGDGMTALHWAAERGDVEIAELLISARANVQAGTRIGAYTPLHIAGKRGHAEVARMLLERGADVNARTTNTGSTPLHLAAAAFNGEDVVGALLDRGADVNAREGSAGQTPLMFAAASNRAASLRELLERGADPALLTLVQDIHTRVRVDQEGERRMKEMLNLARQSGSGELTANQVREAIGAARESITAGRLPSEPLLRPILPTGGRFAVLREFTIRERMVDKWGGMTALLHAARQGHVEAVMALMDAGADINQPSGGDGSSPLLVAALSGHFDLALLLIERGADPNIATATDGITPLFAVINTQFAPMSLPQVRAHEQQQAQYLQVMEALLEAGANPNVRLKTHLWYLEYGRTRLGVDMTGATPFWRAAFAHDVEALRLLASFGAGPSIPTSLPEVSMREGRQQDQRAEDDSGLPPVPAGEPGSWPIHVAAGGGYLGDGGFGVRHVPDGSLPAIRFMVDELGVDVKVMDYWGYTVVHYAAVRGLNDLIRYVVSKGADVTIKTRLGQTTADLAAGGYANYFKRTAFPETVELLQSLGATLACPDGHSGGTGAICSGAIENGAVDYRIESYVPNPL